jgi:hypothetical protein
MQGRTGSAILAAGMLLTLAACGDGTPSLMNLRTGDGPDEFGIVPPKALALPESLTDLPEPTPGGTNRTDRDPEGEAAVALGGRLGAAGGIPAGDNALYAHASRLGVDGGIRATLASEDLEWRRDNKGRILERLFNVNVYYRAYRDQRLDQQAELARWRKLGLRTPSAPPRQEGEE